MNKMVLFKRNFPTDSYRSVFSEVCEKLCSAKCLEKAVELVNGYDLEYDYCYCGSCNNEMLKSVCFRSEIELDRSHIESDADFVSVEFGILYDVKSESAWIDSACLYSNEDDIGAICRFDPDTLEIYEWFV